MNTQRKTTGSTGLENAKALLPVRVAGLGKWNRADCRLPRRGIALIWVAVILLGIIAVIALALDTGLGVLANQQLQNAADGAALAAMNRIRMGGGLDDARTAAINIAAANKVICTPVALDRNTGNSAAGEIVFGWYSRRTATFTPGESAVNAAKVVARRTTAAHGGVPLAFGAGFNQGTVDLSREAIAMRGGGTGAGLIALDPHADCTFDIRGNVAVVVNDVTKDPPEPGTIQVNSDNRCAACADGHPGIEAGTMNVVGDQCLRGADLSNGLQVNPGADVVPDPLAGLAPPPKGETRTFSGESVLLPGYYPAGITCSGNKPAIVTLSPGIYVLDGAGFNISGGTQVIANGVMLYITGTGKFDLTGTAPVTITPPDPTLNNYPGADTYAGVSVFQDRANTGEARITGTSGSNLQGTYYFPSNGVELGGTGIALGNQLIAGQVWIHGTGVFTVNYDGRNPGAGGDIFLVR